MTNLPDVIVSIAIFAAAMLLFESVHIYLREVMQARKRVSERLELLAAGHRTEVMSRFRRSGTDTERNRAVDWIGRRLVRAGIRTAPARFLLLMVRVTLALAVGLPVVMKMNGHPPSVTSIVVAALFAGAVGCGLPLLVVDMKAARRLKKFEQQFPSALDIFVRGLRAGHPVGAALELLTTEVADPTGAEFGVVTHEVNYGLSLKQALDNLAERVGTADVQMFVVCVSIQSETGGNLAEILESLSKVIRERAGMVMKVRALASEGKMSGMMLSVLPVLTFGLVFLNSPSFYLDVADDPLFLPGACMILVMYLAGILTMKKMTNLKV